MAENGHDLIHDAQKVQTLKDLNSLSISKDEEDEEIADDVSDSSSGDFNKRYSGGFEDPKILRLVEGALGAIRKSLENYADLREQGNLEDESWELIQNFANLLEEEKKGHKLSNLVEKLIATDPDSNRHLAFFVGDLYDKKHEQGVSELLDALERYL